MITLQGVAPMAGRTTDAELARQATIYTNFLWAKELTGQERATLNAALSRGTFNAGEFQKWVTLTSGQDIRMLVVESLARDEEMKAINDQVSGPAVEAVEEMQATVVKNQSTALGVKAEDWMTQITAKIELQRLAEVSLGDKLIGNAAAVRSDAVSSLWRNGLLGAGAVVLGLAVAIYVAVEIGRTARIVKSRVEHLGEAVLPALQGAIQAIEQGDLTVDARVEMERIELSQKDELGAVAEAVNRMQDTVASTLTSYAGMRESLRDLVSGMKQKASRCS